MRMAHIALGPVVAAVLAIGKAAVGQEALDDGALRAVGVVEVPAPGAAHEVEGALGCACRQVRL